MNLFVFQYFKLFFLKPKNLSKVDFFAIKLFSYKNKIRIKGIFFNFFVKNTSIIFFTKIEGYLRDKRRKSNKGYWSSGMI